VYGWIVVAVLSIVPTAAAHAASVGHFRLALTTPPKLQGIDGGVRYVVLQPWEQAQARRLRRRDPGLKVLVYQDFGSMTAGLGPDAQSSSGVAYRSATRQHPDWFLADRDGRRIQEVGYPYLFMADVGNAGYRRRWTTDVLGLLRHGPWSGVFMDDVNTSPRPEAGSSVIAGFPTDTAYQAAVRGMLAYAASRIRATGRLVIANMGGWADHPAVVRSWLRYVDGAMDEKFVKYAPAPGEGYIDVRGWLSQLGEVTSTQALHKTFLAVTAARPTDAQAQLYGWASLLLAGDGNAAYLAATDYTGAEPALPAYRTRLGAPAGPMRRLREGAYARSFARGLVLVNPTGHTVRVSLARGARLTEAGQTTMRAHTGLVLARAVARSPKPSRRWPLIAALVLAALLVLLLRRRRPGSGRR
jgi:hypothetical protein